MTKAEFLRKYGYRLSKKTPYEGRYVDEVLARVPNLDWSAVKPQQEFEDGGVTRFIDFAISEGNLVRIAVEVDGFDKTGKRRGMDRREFAEFMARGDAIVAEGWRLIRVANSLIDREPAQCARTVELVLKRERELEERLASLPKSERSTDEARRQLDRELLDADERRELKELNAVHQEAIAELERQLEVEVKRREAAERGRDQAEEARDRSDRDNRGVLKVTRYFLAALVALAALATLAVVVGMSFTTGSSDGLCADAAGWQEARAKEGSSTTIAGPVVSARYQAKVRGIGVKGRSNRTASPIPGGCEFWGANPVRVWGRESGLVLGRAAQCSDASRPSRGTPGCLASLSAPEPSGGCSVAASSQRPHVGGALSRTRATELAVGCCPSGAFRCQEAGH